jgi:hypothetical protein
VKERLRAVAAKGWDGDMIIMNMPRSAAATGVSPNIGVEET